MQTSTLQALQEEEERKQRLQEYQKTNNNIENNQILVQDDFLVSDEVVIQQDNIDEEIEIKETENGINCFDQNNNAEEHDSTDSDIILLDNSIEDIKQKTHSKEHFFWFF